MKKKKKKLYKTWLNLVCIWRRVQLAINKKQKHFSLPDHQLPKSMVFVFGSYERLKKK